MYHEGELEAQGRAGVGDLAERVGRIIRSTIPAAAAEFLAARSFVVVATTNAEGAVHASALGGTAVATDESTIVMRPSSGQLDLVREDVAATGVIGMLAIDFATRRRMRVNGRATFEGDELRVSTSEVYSNCPQYIDERGAVFPVGKRRQAAAVHRIAEAKTFFLATVHPERGADASHRGGPPGFVRVSRDRLSWPDFPGNNMFNSIGNLLVNPRCGLLFLHPDGSALQIEGTAAVQWEGQRRIEVKIERCIGYS
jgi:predicted pyridoxine 5'-phosphate oxidase superfamily flavin-nucleotide-binding protein